MCMRMCWIDNNNSAIYLSFTEAGVSWDGGVGSRLMYNVYLSPHIGRNRWMCVYLF